MARLLSHVFTVAFSHRGPEQDLCSEDLRASSSQPSFTLKFPKLGCSIEVSKAKLQELTLFEVARWFFRVIGCESGVKWQRNSQGNAKGLGERCHFHSKGFEWYVRSSWHWPKAPCQRGFDQVEICSRPLACSAPYFE